jgi:hypothetical protein
MSGDATSLTEPYAGYADASASDVVKWLREEGRGPADLEAVRVAENQREEPRSTVLKALDSLADAPPADPPAAEPTAEGSEDPDANVVRYEEPEDPEKRKYSAADLIANARPLLGASRHAVAGALHGQEDALTLEDASKRLAEFMAEPAVVEEAESE